MPITMTWGAVTPPTPVISNLTATSTGSTTETVTFDVDVASRGFVQYDPDQAGSGYAFSTSLSPFASLSHNFGLTGLAPDTTYRYRAGVTESSGTTTYSSASTFATPVLPTVPTSVVGFGSQATGGGTSAGNIWTVDNNNTSGSGSLWDALTTSGVRRIQFAVDGTIDIPSWCQARGNVTIEGESSGGDGITLTGWIIQWTGVGNGNVIVRNIRHRGEPPGSSEVEGGGGFGAQSGATNFLFQNVSVSGHRSEAIGFWRGAKWVTVQDCIIGPCATTSYPANSRALLFGNGGSDVDTYGATQGLSAFRNLFYLNGERNPAIGYDDRRQHGTSPVLGGDVANNLVWNNAMPSSAYGTTVYWDAKANVRYNYYYTNQEAVNIALGGLAYATGNYSRNGKTVAGNVSTPYAVSSYAVLPYSTDPQAAAASILQTAGCRVGGLDAFDANIINTIQSAGL